MTEVSFCMRETSAENHLVLLVTLLSSRDRIIGVMHNMHSVVVEEVANQRCDYIDARAV